MGPNFFSIQKLKSYPNTCNVVLVIEQQIEQDKINEKERQAQFIQKLHDQAEAFHEKKEEERQQRKKDREEWESSHASQVSPKPYFGVLKNNYSNVTLCCIILNCASYYNSCYLEFLLIFNKCVTLN